jgi:hypothetical protein
MYETDRKKMFVRGVTDAASGVITLPLGAFIQEARVYKEGLRAGWRRIKHSAKTYLVFLEKWEGVIK